MSVRAPRATILWASSLIALTPLIDHYIRPRVYGRTRKGDPLKYGDGA